MTCRTSTQAVTLHGITLRTPGHATRQLCGWTRSRADAASFQTRVWTAQLLTEAVYRQPWLPRRTAPCSPWWRNVCRTITEEYELHSIGCASNRQALADFLIPPACSTSKADLLLPGWRFPFGYLGGGSLSERGPGHVQGIVVRCKTWMAAAPVLCAATVLRICQARCAAQVSAADGAMIGMLAWPFAQ